MEEKILKWDELVTSCAFGLHYIPATYKCKLKDTAVTVTLFRSAEDKRNTAVINRDHRRACDMLMCLHDEDKDIFDSLQLIVISYPIDEESVKVQKSLLDKYRSLYSDIKQFGKDHKAAHKYILEKLEELEEKGKNFDNVLKWKNISIDGNPTY